VNSADAIEEVTEDTITDNYVNTEQAAVKVGQKLERDTRISLTIRFVRLSELRLATTRLTRCWLHLRYQML
jgi:hypothetical protein